MKILYVHTTSVIADFIDALRSIGYEVCVYGDRITEPFPDDSIISRLAAYVKAQNITHIMSIHLQGNVALAARQVGVKYICVIWDAPYYNLFSDYGRMDCCYFSLFDRKDYDRCRARRLPHVLYQPLSVSGNFITRMRDTMAKSGGGHYYWNEVCFVGGLYENNFYDSFMSHAPTVLHDYFIHIFEQAAFRWDGIDRVYGTTSPEILDYLKNKVEGFQFINFFEIEDTELFESAYLIRKLANIERVGILNLLAESHSVTLYTNSPTAKEVLSDVKIRPPVNPTDEAFEVFARSRINLNLTLKGIERGTPQRVFNICAAGGFALTSYCPETAELFEEDREIVMFRSPEELLEKTDYYLTHEEERKKIAETGYQKVLRCYTTEKKCAELMAWVESEGEHS